MVQKYASKLLVRNKGMSQSEAATYALQRIVHKLNPASDDHSFSCGLDQQLFNPHDSRSCAELVKIGE